MDQLVTSEVQGGCGACSKQAGGAKRKLSAYNIFMKKEMKAMKKAHPSKSAAECMQMAARKWRAAHPKKSSSAKPASKKPAAKKSASKKSASKKSGSKKSASRK